MLSLRFQVAEYNMQLFVTKSLQSLVTALHNMKTQSKRKKNLDKTINTNLQHSVEDL